MYFVRNYTITINVIDALGNTKDLQWKDENLLEKKLRGRYSEGGKSWNGEIAEYLMASLDRSL